MYKAINAHAHTQDALTARDCMLTWHSFDVHLPLIWQHNVPVRQKAMR